MTSKPSVRTDFSRSAVIDRALEIADVEGLDAVTVRRIASEFGVTPMALYWHVKNKNELLAAMGDRLFEGLPAAIVAEGPWLHQLRAVMVALVDALRAHPGALTLAGPRILLCEQGRLTTEYTLGLLRGAGFSVQRSADIARMALQVASVLVDGQAGQYFAESEEIGAELKARKQEEIARLPVDRFPNLTASAHALANCDDEVAYYGGGIDLFVAGVEALPRSGVSQGRFSSAQPTPGDA